MYGRYLVWLNLFNAELSLKWNWRRPRSQEVGEEGDYLMLHCYHQNDSCIKVGSDKSHINVSLIVSCKVTKTASTDHNF